MGLNNGFKQPLLLHNGCQPAHVQGVRGTRALLVQMQEE